jgi:hypothetical protein
MKIDRRTFLKNAAAVITGGFARALTIGAAATATTAVASATVVAAATGKYGPGVRARVFEVIVRQGLAGAPWREICAGPMMVNAITTEEVDAEIARRRRLIEQARKTKTYPRA